MVALLPCIGPVVTVKNLYEHRQVSCRSMAPGIEVLPLVSDTVAPLGGAAPVSVTVPVHGVPTGTVLGLTLSDVNVATLIVSVVLLVLPYTAVIVTPGADIACRLRPNATRHPNVEPCRVSK